VKVLLDTHALLWFVLGDPRMSVVAKGSIESFDNQILVSAASAWEVTTKVRIGKLPEAGKFAVEFRERIRAFGFQELSVTVEHGQRAGLLPGTHKDPFDRMLIAQTLTENLEIVSNEEIFDRYLVRRIW
jgi:PIN domain nuclease of toxin-antitoxin system